MYSDSVIVVLAKLAVVYLKSKTCFVAKLLDILSVWGWH